MKYILSVAFIIVGFVSYAQRDLDYWFGNASRIYEISDVEQAAYFPDGERGLEKFVSENLKYPKQVVRMKISGSVYVESIIEVDGSVSVVSVRRGIGGGADQEAMRLIKTMPKWDPATIDGTAVRQRRIIKIVFDTNKTDGLRKG